MTETELRDKVCATALRYLGCKEADGSHRPIIDLYNRIQPLPGGYRMRYTDPWCAAFVSAVGEECGLSAVLLPECSCDRMIARYQAAGRFEEADDAVPRPGDLIFYDWSDNGVGDCRGSADHVGLVVAVTGNLLKTVEGNMSDAVGQRSMHINSRFIRGFARPDYASQCGMMNSEFGIGGAAETSMAVAEPGPAKDRPETSAQAEASAAAPSTHHSEFRIPNSELLAKLQFASGFYPAKKNDQ